MHKVTGRPPFLSGDSVNEGKVLISRKDRSTVSLTPDTLKPFLSELKQKEDSVAGLNAYALLKEPRVNTVRKYKRELGPEICQRRNSIRDAISFIG